MEMSVAKKRNSFGLMGENNTHTHTKTASPNGFLIAICAWESLHTIAVGGVAPHVTEIAAGLARRGNEVHLFVRAGLCERVCVC